VQNPSKTMPELPEVETTRRGIEPFLQGQRIRALVVRESRLRWPIDPVLLRRLPGALITSVGRRGKYLLIENERETLLWHLGMSGSLRIISDGRAAEKHDHVDLVLENGHCLRFNDPRRFGALLWTDQAVKQHPRLMHLGPEPLSQDFDAAYLSQRSRGRTASVKSFLMDAVTVVGVGNIYASEALFLSGIHPRRPAGKISLKRYERLVENVKNVLAAAIEQGGTTLRNFSDSDGKPGYFSQQLAVYGKAGMPCPRCQNTAIRREVIGQRATFFCPQCQK